MPLIAFRWPIRLTLLIAVGAMALLAIVRAPLAQANPVQTSIMMDDDKLVYGTDATRDATLVTMRAAGVDYVRVTVLWRVVALNARRYAAAHHRHFKPSDPASYPPRNWNRYDALVQSAQRMDIGVYFDVTGPGPSYTHGVAPARLRRRVADTWMPDPRQFYQYVTAVGRRYSGSYRVHGQVIPRVSLWSLWNEPNQGGWITPQWKSVGGQLIPYSAIIYRKLFLFGRQALQLTGHGGDSILLGETSPLGINRRTATSEIDPTTFIRELMCAGPTDQPYTGGAAAKRDCQIFGRFGGTLAATGWAHHPYTKTLAPTARDSNPNSITLANISALPTLLDQLAISTHRIRAGLPIISSEYGFETNPPDPFFGIPLAQQASYINTADFLLYLNPRVFGQTQFLLYDAAPLRRYRKGSRRYWSTYQSGILFGNGVAKPSFNAYLLPFVAFPTAPGQLGLWGQLRFLAHNPALAVQPTQQVLVQFQPNGAPATTWNTVATLTVSPIGRHFLQAQIPSPGAGMVRLYYFGQGRSPNRISRAVAIGP